MTELRNNPIVSVIIPCYNYWAFLPETCKSLLEQSFRDWECILINNGSFRDTRAALEPFINADSRFIYLESENNGPSAARNDGLKIARGKYIQFLDADDRLANEKLTEHVKVLDQKTDTDLVYGPVKYFTSDFPEETRKQIMDLSDAGKNGHEGTGKDLFHILIRKNIFVINAPLFRKTILDKAGYFNENLKQLEDWELWMRCSAFIRKFSYCKVDKTSALVRFHAGSLSRDTSGMRSHYLAVMLMQFRPFKVSFKDLLYIIVRLEEDLTNALLNKKRKVLFRTLDHLVVSLHGFVKYLFFCILLPFFFPFYLLIRLYRSFQ